ncbi:MAG: methyltransferase domain-containing protein [Hyphomicrobiales bacterium]
MDVVDLREFYASPLGQMTRRLVARRIRARWPDMRGGARLLGFGYAIPYLDPWRDEVEAAMAFMPARQGVIHWPTGGPSACCLVDECALPLPDNSIDFLLVVHGLELTDHLDDALRELWRVLAPQGRALFVVPNRRGMWARFDSTPFGHGRPFSRSQLVNLLRDAEFTPTGWSHALFAPPIRRGFAIRSAPAIERTGSWLSPGFSGVILVEAVKQVYALSKGKRVRRIVPVLKPQLMPAPALQRTPRPLQLPPRLL